MKKKVLSGTNLAGMSTTRKRVDNDFYATPIEVTEAILNKIKLKGSILEPAAGQGHISKVLKEYYPYNEIISTDLIQREEKFGIPIRGGIDFLAYEFNRKFDNIITNPPFCFIQEFIEKALRLSNDKVIIFAKIQLLESEKRRKMFDESPLKYIYVFTNRVNPLRNGNEFNEKGEKWSSTICFAWFVWEHGYEGEPVVRWL